MVMTTGQCVLTTVGDMGGVSGDLGFLSLCVYCDRDFVFFV